MSDSPRGAPRPVSAVLSAALELRGSRRVEGQRWESLDPLVWWASKLGDSPAVTGLLKAGALARWRNPDDGSSPMRAATKEGHVEVLRALLDFGEPVEADALLQAVRHGHGHLLHFLLDSGVDINHTSSDRGYNTGGMTALHEAAVLGSGQMVADLLAAGADVHRRKLNGTSALYTAAQLGHDDVVRCLLEAGAHPCSGGPMPNGPCPLYWPAASGYLSVAGQLLKAGAKPDDCYNSTTGLYALEAAVSAGHDEVVALLLAYGASASTGLHAAVRARKPALVRRLLDSGADPNVVSTHLHSPDPSTPLLAAAEMGDMESARMLLDAGAAASNPSLLGINGFSPLQAAAAKGHRDMVALLLASGSDPNFRDGARKGTAVYLAALHGHGGAVEQLLVAGADVNTAHQGTGAAPLYAAASCNHLAVVEQLLRAGANVNAHCSQGLTALHMAARCGNRDIAKVLLAAGANVGALHPPSQRTPLHVAAEEGHKHVALLLMDHGAVVTPRLLSAAPAVMALTGWLSEDRARLARENSRLQQGIPQWAAAAASHIFGGAADSAEAAGDNGPRAASTQLGADSPPPANPRLRSIRRRTNSSAAINTG